MEYYILFATGLICLKIAYLQDSLKKQIENQELIIDLLEQQFGKTSLGDEDLFDDLSVNLSS